MPSLLVEFKIQSHDLTATVFLTELAVTEFYEKSLNRFNYRKWTGLQQ